jgi:hypothetical protein
MNFSTFYLTSINKWSGVWNGPNVLFKSGFIIIAYLVTKFCTLLQNILATQHDTKNGIKFLLEVLCMAIPIDYAHGYCWPMSSKIIEKVILWSAHPVIFSLGDGGFLDFALEGAKNWGREVSKGVRIAQLSKLQQGFEGTFAGGDLGGVRKLLRVCKMFLRGTGQPLYVPQKYVCVLGFS